MKCCDCGHELTGNNSALKCVNKDCKRNIDMIMQEECLRCELFIENQKLNDKLAEVSKNTSNFIKNVINTFPEVGLWILTNKENIITENVEFGDGGTWIDPTLTLNENIINEKGSK